MQFTDAKKIYDVIELMRKADIPRAANRAMIDQLFNGFPPYSEGEAQDNKIQTNVNFLEPAKIAHDARTQFNNAYLGTPKFFTVNVNYGKEHEREEWSKTITKHVNEIMKKSRKYMEMSREKFSQVVLHGIGPVVWQDKFQWCPEFVGIMDLLIPTRTLVGLSNLEHFAIYRQFTVSELFEKTNGPKVDKGWNVPLVGKIIETLLKAEGASSITGADYRFPEKLAEDIKANPGYYESDATPTVNCWDFYFKTKEGEWHRRIVVDEMNPTSAQGITFVGDILKNQFLFNPGNRPYAADLMEILQIQFADGNNVPPFRYHSVRSLGFMLYAVCHLQNRMRCRLVDHAMEGLLTLFTNVSAEDRERLEMVDLQNMGVIPQGLKYVPANERYTIDPNLVTGVMSQNRQSMQENSASFVQDVNNGTKEGITATEAMARMTTANSLVSGMLQLSYTYETYQYREICRRFCIKSSPDEGVQKFRKKCLEDGVPEEALDVSLWNVYTEQTLGNGNKLLRLAAANQLMAIAPKLDPEGQRVVLHMYVDAVSDIANLANRIVPMGDEKPVSEGTQLATLAIGTLLQGLPVALPRTLNRVDYIETLIQLLATKVARYRQSGQTPDQDQLNGLITAFQHIQQNIQLIAEDEGMEQRVKQYGDGMGQIGNILEQFAQNFQEQAQKQNPQMSPEAIGKILSMKILAESQARIREMSEMQKMRQRQDKFQQQMMQKAIQFRQDLGMSAIEFGSDMNQSHAEHRLDMVQTAQKAATQPESQPA